MVLYNISDSIYCGFACFISFVVRDMMEVEDWIVTNEHGKKAEDVKHCCIEAVEVGANDDSPVQLHIPIFVCCMTVVLFELYFSI